MMHDSSIALSRPRRHASLKYWLACIALFFLWLPHGQAAFSLEATRLIYNEKERTAQITANNSGSMNYLVQSWVENIQGEQSNDFIPLPPIFKLNAGEKNAIQVTRHAELSPDRETLYWLNVQFVPPSDKDEVNVLRYSLTNRIKLIYRPHALKNVFLPDEVKRLRFSREGQELVVENPTGVYVNINQIQAGGAPLQSPGYFAPFSTTRLVLEPANAQPGAIELEYITDYGSTLTETFGQ